MKKSEIITAIVCFLFITGGLIYGLSSKDPDRSSWVLSVGRIYLKSEFESRLRGVEHWVNGKRYEGLGGYGLEGNTVGDIYQILVNPNNYEEIFLLEERPIFLKEEKIGETTGWIEENYKLKFYKTYKGEFPKFMDYNEGFNHVSIKYYYRVNNKKYSRVQDFSMPVNKSIVFQKGMRFKVRYWLENPQRSIIDYEEKR